jgi:hypothetical protein
MTCTLPTLVHVRVQRTLPVGSPCMWQPFASHPQHWMNPTALEKRAPDITPSPADRSAGPPPSFSPNTTIEVVIKAKHLSAACY